MKRKYLAWAVAAALVLFGAVYFGPRHVIKADDNVEWGRCEYYSEEFPNGVYLELTAEQADGVLDVLEGLWCFRVWGEDVHFLADQVLQITLYVDDHQPFHVVLGRRDFCYGGARGPFQQFDIIGGDKATSQIFELLNIDENQVNINGRREI